MKFPITSRRTVAGLAATAALAATMAIGLGGIADAAHGGALTGGEFSGRAEVGPEGNMRIVGDPNGRGEAYVFSTGDGIVCYVLEVDKIGPATAAHIHEAPAGENGPVVVALSPPTDGESAGCIDTGDPDLAADITLREPSEYYVNVHNDEYPAGAVRAQLGG